MNDTPKHPCKICDKIAFHKRDYKKEPCASCPLPGEYDDALKEGFFPIAKFLRTSTPNREPGRPKISNVPLQEPQHKAKEDEPMPAHTENEIVDPGGPDAPDVAKTEKENDGSVVMVPEKEKAAIPKKKDRSVKQQSGLKLLKKYCELEETTVEHILSKSRSPVIAISRQNVAIALYEKEGMDYRTIAALMKKSPSSVWAYINSGLDNNSDRLVDKILHELPETHKQLKVLAKRDLRLPLDQIRFIVREYCGREKHNA